MSSHRPQPNAGFTIIETLIVLGIAGLIFLIIFMAIPTLIRNSRNSQRKQDVSTVLSAISHYQLNHSGTSFPSACSPPSADQVACTVGAPPNEGFIYYVKDKLSYYEPANVLVHVQAANTNTTSVTTNAESVDLYNFAICTNDNSGATGKGAGYRDIVALFKIDTSNGVAVKCQQL